MSIDYHRHCQKTILSANGTGNGNGATWPLIRDLNLPNLDGNWLSYFSNNKQNITQDIQGILYLINDVSGSITSKGRDIELSIGDQTLSFNTLIQKPDEILSINLPIATPSRLGTIKIGDGFAIGSDGKLSVSQGIINGVRELVEGSNVTIRNLGEGKYEINSVGGSEGGSGGVINGEKYDDSTSHDITCDLTSTFTDIYTARHDCYLVIYNKSLVNKGLIFGIDGNPIQATPEYLSVEEYDNYAFGVPVKMDTTIQCKCSEGSISLVFDFIEYKLYKSNPSEDGYVSRIVAGTNVEVSPNMGTGQVTINAKCVSKIIAGDNITLDPVEGTGEVKISASGGYSGNVYDENPIGTIIAYSADLNPDGYLTCDGSAVSRVTYKQLFDVIGTKYGEGDGTNTFNLPTLNDGRYLRGDSEITGTKIEAGLPLPTIQNNGSHTHSIGFSRGQSGWNPTVEGSVYGCNNESDTTGSGGEHTHEIVEDGVYGNSDTVTPKSLGVRYLIKYKLTQVVDHVTIDQIYPIGSIYIGLQETCPIEILIPGSTWEKIEGGRSIWTKEDNQTLGELVNGILPKHTHITTKANQVSVMAGSGALGVSGVTYISTESGDISKTVKNVEMGTTLRPPSLVVNIWKRTN